jgi:anthranilate phosphoribosyltransferase
VSHEVLDPVAIGIAPAAPEALKGKDATHNAEVVRRLLAGAEGPVRDAVLLNAGAALAAYEGADGPLQDRVAQGMAAAAAALDSGAASAVLDRWTETATRLADS